MERHDLLHEFPEHKEKIHQLKTEDAHFRGLFDQYHELEHEIHRINSGVETTTEDYLHTLKAKSLYIKDELFTMLTK